MPLKYLLAINDNFTTKFYFKALNGILTGMMIFSNQRRCVKSVRIRSFSGPYFPAFRLRIESEFRKIRDIKTPNSDIFHVVGSCKIKKMKSEKHKREPILTLLVSV